MIMATKAKSPPRRVAAGKAEASEVVLRGLGVSSGIAIGTAIVRDSGTINVPEYPIRAADVPGELTRFNTALKRVRKQLEKLKIQVGSRAKIVAEEIVCLLDAHLHMIDGSRLIRGIEKRIRNDKINAEAAVWGEIIRLGEQFSALDDPYLAGRSSDVRELGTRLIHAFNGKEPTATPIRARGIVVADELTPSDTVLLDPDQTKGFVTVAGGPQSHTAIMARSLQIPAVLGVRRAMSDIRPGTHMIIDGERGKVILHPAQSTLDIYGRRLDTIHGEVRRLSTFRKKAARTRDGTTISLLSNIELPRECNAVHDSGAEGIGLLRSEYLFMNREDLPDEEEQFGMLRDIVTAMRGQVVTVRTLDIGGEKLATSLGGYLEDVDNPALGLRAVRLSLKFPDLFETQLAAILRAGAYGPVAILLPMISSGHEVTKARALCEKVAARLRAQNLPCADPLPPLGAMIETPGAAMAADSLARLCDFFAIGTNDLTMYTLAIDRGNEQVAELYNPLHPSLLRLIQFTAQAAWQAGIACSLCGEIAGDARYTALLIGLGIHQFSMAPASIPRIKEKIFSIDASRARRMANRAVTLASSDEILRAIDDFDGQKEPPG